MPVFFTKVLIYKELLLKNLAYLGMLYTFSLKKKNKEK